MDGDVTAMEIGRRLVAQLAPDELPLFDQTWQVLDRHPRRSGRHREDPLGFGLPEASMVLVTAVVSGVMATVIKDLGKDVGSALGRLLTRLRLRKVKELPDPLPALPPQRLRQIRVLARRQARKLGLPADKADALAHALVSELSTAERQP